MDSQSASPPQPPRPLPSAVRRRARRGCLTALLVFAILITLPFAFGAYFRAFHSPWPKPPEGVRLDPRTPLIPRSELTESDVQYHLLACTSEVHRVDGWHEDYERWVYLGRHGAPYPALAEFTQTNADWLAHIARAAHAPSNRWHFTLAFDEPLPWLSPCISCFRQSGWQAWTAEQEAGPDAADAHLRDTLQLATHMFGSGSLIQHLVGLHGIRAACDHIARAAVDEPAPSPARLNQWIRMLHEFEPTTDSLFETLRYEYLFVSNTTHQVYSSSDMESELYSIGLATKKRSRLLRLAGSTLPRTQRHIADTYKCLLAQTEHPSCSGGGCCLVRIALRPTSPKVHAG